MGTSLSRWNNKLSFDFEEYLRERDELAGLLKQIAESSMKNRKQKETFQLVNGATSVTAAVAGTTIAIIAAPATFGLSLPVLATTTAIVGNSLAAASITSSAVSYGHGYMVSKDMVKQLENLQCMIDCIARKDKEVHELLKSKTEKSKEQEEEEIHRVSQVGKAFDKKISFADDEKAKNTSLVAWSILSPATYTLLQGKTQFQSEQDFEQALTDAADKLTTKTEELRLLNFKHFDCIPLQQQLSRGRLTHVDGGGCVMKVSCNVNGTKHDIMESDTTKVIRLPQGATDVKVTFTIKNGGGSVKQVNRRHAKQPWIKNDKGERVVEEICLDRGDGVDAVFCIKGTLTHAYVQKAYDFGRHPQTTHGSWEWWPSDTLEEDRKSILPDSEKRNLQRNMEESLVEPLSSCAAFSCCGPSAINVVA